MSATLLVSEHAAARSGRNSWWLSVVARRDCQSRRWWRWTQLHTVIVAFTLKHLIDQVVRTKIITVCCLAHIHLATAVRIASFPQLEVARWPKEWYKQHSSNSWASFVHLC